VLRAIYVRTLKDGVSDDDYIAAWMPEGVAREDYPAKVTISHSTVNERETVTVFEFEGEPGNVLDELADLVRPDWRDRVAEVVDDTAVETIFTESSSYGSIGRPGS